jgi:hydrogenase nickel incorporation protein HypB
VVQINTAGGCHLDAFMVAEALDSLPLDKVNLLFIENVGNLICPAAFALGEHKKVVIASIPEGDDKPYKYPLMFTTVDAVVLNKIDLLPYVKFNTDAFIKAVMGINAKVKIFPVSCTTGNGIPAWAKWLKAQMRPARNK